MMEYTNCDLCGSYSSTVIWDKDYGYGKSIHIMDNGDVVNSKNVVCDKCGLVYINPRATESFMDNYYKGEYRKNFRPDIKGEYSHAVNAINFFNKTRNYLPEKCYRRTLDIGCSTGILVGQFQGIGSDAHGIDQCEKTIEVGKSKGLKLKKIALEEYDPECKFSLITILNTLEHLYSPKKSLLQIRNLLTDDGICLISVPDIFTTYNWSTVNGFLSSAHLYTFSARTLLNYLDVCGFEPLTMANSVEPNFAKIYAIVRKCEQKDTVFKPIEPLVLRERLKCLDYLYKTYVEEEAYVKNHSRCL